MPIIFSNVSCQVVQIKAQNNWHNLEDHKIIEISRMTNSLRYSVFGMKLPIAFSQVLKVRLNLQQVGTYHGVVACATSIYRHESMSSFYKGFKPSILCMIPYAGVECAVHQVRQNTSNGWKIKSLETHHHGLLCFFPPITVYYELGNEGSSLQQWLQTVFLQFCGLCFWTNNQLSPCSNKDSTASTR